MALTADFRWATPYTVEVRFYEGGEYRERDPFAGSCNIHITRAAVEISMMHGEFQNPREVYELLKDWLSKRGITRVDVERHGRLKEYRSL